MQEKFGKQAQSPLLGLSFFTGHDLRMHIDCLLNSTLRTYNLYDSTIFRQPSGRIFTSNQAVKLVLFGREYILLIRRFYEFVYISRSSTSRAI